MDTNLHPIFSLTSMRVMSDQASISNDIDDSALMLLSEDATYRLRQVIKSSFLNALHMNRKTLLLSDIESALELQEVDIDVPAIGNNFIRIPELDIYTVDDHEVDIVKKCQELIKSGMRREVRKYQTDINFNWLAIDGIRVTTDAQEDRIAKELSPSLEAYIDQIVDTINGTSEQAMEIVTNDLASNEHAQKFLSQLFTRLLNISEDGASNHHLIGRLIGTIESLMKNPKIMIVNESQAEDLISILFNLILRTRNANERLREKILNLMALILDHFESRPVLSIHGLVEKQLHQMELLMRESTRTIESFKLPFECLCYLRHNDAISVFINIVEATQEKLTETDEGAKELRDQILSAAEYLLSYQLENLGVDCINFIENHDKLCKLMCCKLRLTVVMSGCLRDTRYGIKITDKKSRFKTVVIEGFTLVDVDAENGACARELGKGDDKFTKIQHRIKEVDQILIRCNRRLSDSYTIGLYQKKG